MKKPIITVDIETYSPQDIAKVGAYRYAQDPDFQILLLGYVNEGLDTPKVIDLTSWPDTAHFLREQLPWLLDASYTKRAHNAAFEWWCLSEAMGLSWEERAEWLDQWECSMIHALYCGLPAQLGALGQVLQQPEDALKMKEGKALITEEQTAESKTLTGLTNPGSRAQLLGWLHNRGIALPGLTKEDVTHALAGELPSDVRRVLELRQQLGKTSNTKYETIAASAGPDHRVRGTLQFYGASRTGRWAGRLLQVQNLPRTYLDHQAEWRSVVKLHDPEALALLTDNVSDTLSQLIRTALVPGKGCTFVDADFSAIEARLIAWLAGEEWVLDVFRTTGKIYEATAARIFGVPFDSIVKGNPNYKYRQRGKVATLALGYQGGVGAMKRMGGDQLGLDDDGLMDIVRRWRRQNPSICKLWDTMQKAAVHTIRTGRTTVPRVGVTLRKELALGFPFPFLTMQLPSGRKLFYADPGTTPDDRITYKEWDTGSWREAETYGGKLTENLTQAVGRDCLAFALDNLRRAGYQVVFHVHDEVIIELPTTQDAEAALDNVVRIMSIVPPWAEGLPLNAAGWYGDFFTKD